jgi:hypothetical protein
MRGCRCALVLLAIVAMMAAPARADEDAKAVFTHGMTLFQQHQFAGAAREFERSFELRPDPAILYNAAQAHRLAGHNARALELYESLLRMYGDRIGEQQQILEHVRQLRAIVAAEPANGAAPAAPAAPPPALTGATASGDTLATPSTRRAPERRRRWVWGVVAGGAALVIAGVTLGVVLGTQKTMAPPASFGMVAGN